MKSRFGRRGGLLRGDRDRLCHVGWSEGKDRTSRYRGVEVARLVGIVEIMRERYEQSRVQEQC